MKIRNVIFSIFATGLFAAGCSAEPQGVNESASTVEEGIINGTVENAENTGYVKLSSNLGGCSGTLVANQWVLTAKHCTNAAATATTVSMGTQSTTGLEYVKHPSLDIALIHLTKPLKMNGSPYLYHRAFYNSTHASLVGRNVTCHGYGVNTTTASGFGTLRTASVPVGSSDGTGYTVLPNASGQIPFSGDSGSSCFASDGSIAGVNVTCACKAKPGTACSDANGFIYANVAAVTSCYDIGSASIRDWAHAVIEPVPGDFTAVWRPNNGSGEVQVYGWSYTDFRAKYDQLWNQGWRLHLLQPYVSNGNVLYNAVWRPGTGGEVQVYGWSYTDFRAKYDELWGQGWRLKLLEPYVVNNQVLYTAVWTPSTEGEIQVYGWSYTDFRAKYDQLWNQGWRLKLIQPYVVNGQVLYTAAWRPGNDSEVQVYGWSYADFRAEYDQLWSQGWRLFDLKPYRINGTTLYTAVWRPGNGGELQIYTAPYNDFRQEYDDVWPQNWRLEMLRAL